MRTVSLDGAWYSAALPDGEHAELYAQARIGTSRGEVALPPSDQPLFLDAGVIDGQLCIAGQSHAGHGLLIWDGTHWRMPGLSAFGETPVAFGLDDEILTVVSGDTLARYHLRTGAISYERGLFGVDGLHAVLETGAVIRGNNTRADQARAVWEFIEWGDVTVGQSVDYACVALHGGKRYVLVTGAPPGGCRAIRLKRQGDQLAVAVHLPTEARTVLIWCSVAELAQFPEQSLSPPPVPPHPEPITMATVPNKSAELNAFWNSFNGRAPITDDVKKHLFTGNFASQLASSDPRFGRKSRTGNAPLSKDTLAYWLSDPIPATPTDGKIDAVDIISSTGQVGWDTRAEHGDPAYRNIDARWFPMAGVPAQPPPPPAPNVHLYDGGENDTGICDICHLSRFDPVHVTAESKVRHAYNGGEQDTGLCDICQKPASEPIHDLNPQQPPGGTTSPGGTVSLDDGATQLLTQILESCHAQEERQAETVAAVQELREAVVGAGKNLTGELIKAAPGILAVLLPLLKGSAVKKPVAKRKRR